MKKGPSKDIKKPEKNCVWTDEETTLLVQMIIDYKAYKAADVLDWESVKKKLGKTNYDPSLFRFCQVNKDH